MANHLLLTSEGSKQNWLKAIMTRWLVMWSCRYIQIACFTHALWSMDTLYRCKQPLFPKNRQGIRKETCKRWIHHKHELNKTLYKRYGGVMVVVYKNIIQSSTTACIPELQLAFLFPITHSTSTAYEENTDSKKQRLQTIDFTLNSIASACSRPWHFVRQNQTSIAIVKQKLGYQTLTNIHFY